MAYTTGNFSNFIARLHTASTVQDLSDYLDEGENYVAEYQDEINTYYNLFFKWACEYVKRNYSITGEYLPRESWPFLGTGGNTLPTSADSIMEFAALLAELNATNPAEGDSLTINSQSVGNFDYCVKDGNQTLTSFTASDWFTNTEDTASSWVIVKGNLNLSSGSIVFRPTVRKLFTVIYVTGDLTIGSGCSISMTERGANHSGTGNSGGYTAPVNIRLANGTYSSILNPQIPATGGAGAARRTNVQGDGYNSGTAGSAGGTGGGGGGYRFSTNAANWAGSGSAGTCFCGGGGSGSIFGGAVGVGSGDAVENGGAGSAGVGSTPVGGAGNPKGSGGSFNSGLSGVVIVICLGQLSGAGTIVSNGVDTQSIGGITGGAGGGGSVNVFYGTNPSGVTVTANGGSTRGGANGTARKLAIP